MGVVVRGNGSYEGCVASSSRYIGSRKGCEESMFGCCLVTVFFFPSLLRKGALRIFGGFWCRGRVLGTGVEKIICVSGWMGRVEEDLVRFALYFEDFVMDDGCYVWNQVY